MRLIVGRTFNPLRRRLGSTTPQVRFEVAAWHLHIPGKPCRNFALAAHLQLQI